MLAVVTNKVEPPVRSIAEGLSDKGSSLFLLFLFLSCMVPSRHGLFSRLPSCHHRLIAGSHLYIYIYMYYIYMHIDKYIDR